MDKSFSHCGPPPNLLSFDSFKKKRISWENKRKQKRKKMQYKSADRETNRNKYRNIEKRPKERNKYPINVYFSCHHGETFLSHACFCFYFVLFWFFCFASSHCKFDCENKLSMLLLLLKKQEDNTAQGTSGSFIKIQQLLGFQRPSYLL